MYQTYPLFPLSNNKHHCIGPCYHSNVIITHPTSKTKETSNQPFCPTEKYIHIDDITGIRTQKYIDGCTNPTDYDSVVLNNAIIFDELFFLDFNYGIKTFEDAIAYIENKQYLPANTKLRIMDCAISCFDSYNYMLDARVVAFYLNVAEKLWVKNIYKTFHRYIHINNENQIYLDIDKYDDNTDDKKEIKLTFIKQKITNSDEIFKFLTKYVKYNMNDWRANKRHSENMAYEFLKYIEKKINLTLFNL